MTAELAGLVFFAALAAGIYFGLRALAKGRVSTEEEFERASEESASLLGAGVSALHGALQPDENRRVEAARELKEGQFGRKKNSGDGRPSEQS